MAGIRSIDVDLEKLELTHKGKGWLAPARTPRRAGLAPQMAWLAAGYCSCLERHLLGEGGGCDLACGPVMIGSGLTYSATSPSCEARRRRSAQRPPAAATGPKAKAVLLLDRSSMSVGVGM